MTYKKQLEILETIQGQGFNVTTCGNCGGVVLFDNETSPSVDNELEEVVCPHCKSEMDYADFPDLYHSGMQELEDEKTDSLQDKPHLKEQVLYLFESYLDERINKGKLISGLYLLEIMLTDLDHIGSENIWFKFFKGDTLATTIANIDMDEKGNFLKENMQIAIDNPEDFQVFFS